MKPRDLIVAGVLLAGGLVYAGTELAPLTDPEPPASAPAGAAPEHAAARLASVDLYRVAERLIKQPKYAGAIQDARESAEQTLRPLMQELEELRTKIQTAGGPQNAPADVALFQQKQPVFAQAQQQAERDFERVAAQTNHAAYDTVLEAAQRIAAARGYTHVFATRPPTTGPGPDTPLQFTLGVLSRPLVIFPAGDDLTESVMAELGLD